MSLRHRVIEQSALSLLRALGALGTAAARGAARAAKALRHRRDLEFLAELDDRMLKDIGLNRSDLRFALSEPFWRDPGAVLIARVGQRGIARCRPTSVPTVVPAGAGRNQRTGAMAARSKRAA